MIHLDTNYLIGLLIKGSPQSLDVDGWLAAGESLAASAIVWTEFLNGPVTPLEVSRAEAVLQSRIIPFSMHCGQLCDGWPACQQGSASFSRQGFFPQSCSGFFPKSYPKVP